MKSFAFAAIIATASAVPSGWSDWASTSTTSSKPADKTTTSSYDPSHTWEDWTSTSTSSKPADKTTTSSYDPSHTWADWSSSSSTPAKETTSSYDPSHTWADWSSETYTTTVVTAIETYCAKATTFVHASSTYSCSESQTVTVTNCGSGCTISVPVATKTSSSCADYQPTPGYWNPVAPAAASSGWNTWASAAPTGTGAYVPDATSAYVAAYTGAANRVANVGAGLAGVAAAAAFLL